jgi:hypothetical protein
MAGARVDAVASLRTVGGLFEAPLAAEIPLGLVISYRPPVTWTRIPGVLGGPSGEDVGVGARPLHKEYPPPPTGI